MVSPYARPGYVATRHYSTASIVKTEELLLGLPPNNLGDLFATDLRDMFQPVYNGIGAVPVTRTAEYVPSKEGVRIWQLAKKLDQSGPDRDSARLGELARLSMAADDLYREAGSRKTGRYKTSQKKLYKLAEAVLKRPRRDADD